ncbi:MAG: hypothetical protein ACERJ2_15630, partial [Filomicrobium sp.]
LTGVPIDVLGHQDCLEFFFFDGLPSPRTKEAGASVWPLLPEKLFKQIFAFFRAQSHWSCHGL